MPLPYKVEIINPSQKETLMSEFYSSSLYERKALIHGTCIKMFSDSHSFKDMWEDNFEQLPDWIRPHARLFSICNGNGTARMKVRYEPISKTVIIENCDYYGYVKSIALALVADFLEDFTSEHRRYSVHGSFVDAGGRGLAIIGPSGSGKTTLTYGLLLDKRYNFVTDDWFFVRFANNDTLIYSSEKNSYIRGNLSENWPQYASRLADTQKDEKDRAVIDVKRLLGGDRIRTDSTLEATVILTRDKSQEPFTEMSGKDALAYLVKNDFCNPHQLVRTRKKMEKRRRFYSEFLGRAPVYLLNTIESPKESLERIKKLSGC